MVLLHRARRGVPAAPGVAAPDRDPGRRRRAGAGGAGRAVRAERAGHPVRRRRAAAQREPRHRRGLGGRRPRARVGAAVGRRPPAGRASTAPSTRAAPTAADLLLVTNDDAVEFRLVRRPVPGDADQDHTAWVEVRPEDPAERLERVDAFAGHVRAEPARRRRAPAAGGPRTTTWPARGCVLRSRFPAARSTWPATRRTTSAGSPSSTAPTPSRPSGPTSTWRPASADGRAPAARRRATTRRRTSPSGCTFAAAGRHAGRRRPSSGTATPRWTAPRPRCSTGTAPTRPSTSRSGTRRCRACSTAASSGCTRTSAAAARAAGAGGWTGGSSTSSTRSTTTSRSPTGWRDGLVDGTRIATRGLSAGGLLQGAVFSQRPDRWRAVVAEVPFVDVVTTMFDASIPLTITEWDEWGDPRPQGGLRLDARLLAVRQPAAGRRPARPAGDRRRARPAGDGARAGQVGGRAARDATRSGRRAACSGASSGPARTSARPGRFGHLAYEAEVYAWVLDRLGVGLMSGRCTTRSLRVARDLIRIDTSNAPADCSAGARQRDRRGGVPARLPRRAPASTASWSRARTRTGPTWSPGCPGTGDGAVAGVRRAHRRGAGRPAGLDAPAVRGRRRRRRLPVRPRRGRHEERGRGARGGDGRAGPVAGSGRAATCGSSRSPTRRTAWPTSACAGCSRQRPDIRPDLAINEGGGERLRAGRRPGRGRPSASARRAPAGAGGRGRRGRARLDAERRRQRRPAARASCCAGSAAACPTPSSSPWLEACWRSCSATRRRPRRRRGCGRGAAPEPGRRAAGADGDHDGADRCSRARPSAT